MEQNRILYANAYEDSRVYALNKAYWSRIIKSIIGHTKEYTNDWGIPNIRNAYKWEEIPIYNYYSRKDNKCISILQYSSKSYYESCGSKYTTNRYFTAWLDKIEIDSYEVPQLVICLVNTQNNRRRTEELIKCWFFSEQEELEKMFQNIYKEHDNNE